MNINILRFGAETDRLVGTLARHIAERTGRDPVRVIVDLLQAADVAGLDPDDRLEVFRARVVAQQRYCEAEGLDLEAYVEAQHESDINQAVARIRRAMES